MERIVELDRIGVEYRADYLDEKVEGIYLPFNPEQMLDACHAEGQLLGSCCGKISAMRDILIDSLRDNRFVDADALSSLVALMKTHEGFEDLFDAPDDTPWGKIAVAWKALEGRLGPTRSRARDPRNLDDAIDILSMGCTRLAWRRLLTHAGQRPPGVTDEQWAESQARDRFEDDLHTAEALSHIAPAMATLHARLAERHPGPVEGFAVTLRKAGSAESAFGHGILDTVGGPAIYMSRERAQGTIDHNAATDATFAERARIRPVRVSVANGIEFLDEG